jgi:Fe-S-cluster containining protein
MAGRTVKKDDTIQIGGWKVERRLATARIEGRGPMSVADECSGRCCHHGVYIALPERDRIREYADVVSSAMDDTQPTDPAEWFEDETHEDEDYPGGLCIGTAVHNDKCVFLNRQGLCVLQQVEPSLDLPEGERLKPFYCRLFPLTTWYSRLEFDDMCDGVRPCCTLAADGPTRVVDAWAYEFTEALGKEGYQEFRGVAGRLEEELNEEKRAAR